MKTPVPSPQPVHPQRWSTNDTATNTISGTSMATPHVTGAAALYLSTNPEALPTEVSAAITLAAPSRT